MYEVFQLLSRPLDSTASASTECQQILCTARKMKTWEVNFAPGTWTAWVSGTMASTVLGSRQKSSSVAAQPLSSTVARRGSRWSQRIPPGPLYRMHCSSTASGVANMYSFSNPTNLAATPLDAAVAGARLLVDPHSLAPTESRTSMPRGHTFSRESRPIAVDLNISELGEMSDRVPATRTGLLSPEPPPPYNSSRDEQRPDSAVQILSHGTSFSQQTFNPSGSTRLPASIGLRPSPCVVSQTSSPGTSQIESELPSISQTFTNTGTPLAACTTFNPSATTQPTPTEQVAGSTSVVVQGTVSGVGPVLLPASSIPPLTTSVARGNDALYHSTKF